MVISSPPISVELRVGALEETVTVTGESPIVDVQSARVQTVIEDCSHHAGCGPIRAHGPAQ